MRARDAESSSSQRTPGLSAATRAAIAPGSGAMAIRPADAREARLALARAHERGGPVARGTRPLVVGRMPGPNRAGGGRRARALVVAERADARGGAALGVDA